MFGFSPIRKTRSTAYAAIGHGPVEEIDFEERGDMEEKHGAMTRVYEMSEPKGLPYVGSLAQTTRSRAADAVERIGSLELIPTLKHIGRELVPTFLRPSDPDSPPEKLLPTAFLDGLRGVAAFFVFHQHFLQAWTHQIFWAWGHDGGPSHIMQLPFIRLVCAGQPMVYIFFGVSGYSLAYGPLKARRDHSWEKMLASVNSSVFRRGVRLFLPCIVVSFIFMTLVYLGLCESNRSMKFPGGPDRFPDRAASYAAQLALWARMIRTMTEVWSWKVYFPNFDPHLWTIRIEFMGSLVLYLVMCGTARMQAKVRLPLLFAIVCYVNHYGRWELFMFLGGLFVAETDMLRNVHRRSREEVDLPSRRSWRTAVTPSGFFWTANLVCSLWLLSVPLERVHETPGFKLLFTLIPKSWDAPGRMSLERIGFWWAIGALQLIWTTSNSPTIQKAFTNPVAQYLGKVSYALYILHGPLLYSVGYTIARNMQGLIGVETQVRKWTVIGVEYLVMLPVLFTISDICWRLVDKKSVAFARWIQEQCFVPAIK